MLRSPKPATVLAPRFVGPNPTPAARLNQSRPKRQLQPGFRTAQPKPHGSVNLSIRLLAVDRKEIHGDLSQLPDRMPEIWKAR